MLILNVRKLRHGDVNSLFQSHSATKQQSQHSVAKGSDAGGGVLNLCKSPVTVTGSQEQRMCWTCVN